MLQYEDIIKQMSLEEKAIFLTGKSVWESRDFPQYGIPSCFFADGPHGLRKQAGAADHLGLNASEEATCFPTAAAIANSWDIKLGEEIGMALGREARSQGVDVVLGPGLNIKRNPLCGRNFEYFSEDPYLSGKMAAGYIKGIQSQGVAACPKHFAVNNQERRRMASDSIIDERTLREIYLTGFEIAVTEAKPRTIMSSYNRINGEYAHENTHLLQEILRQEWGFEGAVVTDWGGGNDCVKAVKNGGTLEMPSAGGDSCRQLIDAVRKGELDEADIDTRVDELIRVVMEISDHHEAGPEMEELRERHHQLAKEAACAAAVLLKNEGQILPLQPQTKVGVIGDFAETPRYQGAGSSIVNTSMVDKAAAAFSQSQLELIGVEKGFERNGGQYTYLKERAVHLAQEAEVVILYLGLPETSETEGVDRSHMRLPDNQIELLEELAEVNPNIVVVLSAGSAVEVEWQGRCKALLYAGLCGEAGAGAMVEIITGKADPAGRLSETYPHKLEDVSSYHYFSKEGGNAEYREGIYVGYRYFETAGVPVAFPFGYGLSYTRFEYCDLQLDQKGVSFTIANIGDRDGWEVPQLYVACRERRIFRAAKELKGFEKIFVKSGEKKRVTIPFDDKTFRYFNADTDQWEVEAGVYEILIGANVRDIKLSAAIECEGSEGIVKCGKKELPQYYTGKVQDINDQEFLQLLGRTCEEERGRRVLAENNTVGDMRYAKSGIARWVCRRLEHLMEKKMKAGKPDLNLIFVSSMPFRAIAKMTEGQVNMKMVGHILEMVNGHVLKGVVKIVPEYFRNRRENRALERRLAEDHNRRS
ncbi:glycoside hydrolase family 3 C-terminal domain-containing protein [Ohessyouella blattaphilus]|uniref:Glycoside hydrolase family 3 C-terminal domain-containing protein n=1 Tax=Ohessyouella blattaphilus TaxID=2949333 RepID=A0ABT1EI86_9FIRM|nr:glycoside hydrolase family 3 C-terminal domain-containing protein [Ohessyouella blattaphilus]MCP1110418.1 glycoside hydrolase family 3 C-terminal domain-containing protein [Ohessyouella blattaphilus]MCR8563812.1 glycoside hydrolase family 3 C-terminal domain-containing protein [Ohessyouella blattaphilus]